MHLTAGCEFVFEECASVSFVRHPPRSVLFLGLCGCRGADNLGDFMFHVQLFTQVQTFMHRIRRKASFNPTTRRWVKTGSAGGSMALLPEALPAKPLRLRPVEAPLPSAKANVTNSLPSSGTARGFAASVPALLLTSHVQNSPPYTRVTEHAEF